MALAFMAGGSVKTAQAQHDAVTLKTNLAAPISLYAAMGLTNHFSLEGGMVYEVVPTYHGVAVTSWRDGLRDHFGMSAPVEIRWYARDQASEPWGMHFGLYARYSYFQYTYDGAIQTGAGVPLFGGPILLIPTTPTVDHVRGNTLAVGGNMGYGFVLAGKLVADIGLGLGTVAGAWTKRDRETTAPVAGRDSPGVSPFSTRLQVQVGYPIR